MALHIIIVIINIESAAFHSIPYKIKMFSSLSLSHSFSQIDQYVSFRNQEAMEILAQEANRERD